MSGGQAEGEEGSNPPTDARGLTGLAGTEAVIGVAEAGAGARPPASQGLDRGWTEAGPGPVGGRRRLTRLCSAWNSL